MTKEATQSALDKIEENKLDIEAIEGSGTDGKVTAPDVEKYMAEMEEDSEEVESESDDEPDSDDEAPEDDSSEEDAEDEGGESDESESDAEEESEEVESGDNESEPEPESGDCDGEGTLVCVLAIKGQDKPYAKGDVYEGDNVKHLLSRGAIKRK